MCPWKPIRERVTTAGLERRCRKCREWWILESYERHPNGKGGRLGVCKACRAGRPH